jgi:hypothetical protein
MRGPAEPVEWPVDSRLAQFIAGLLVFGRDGRWNLASDAAAGSAWLQRRVDQLDSSGFRLNPLLNDPVDYVLARFDCRLAERTGDGSDLHALVNGRHTLRRA